MRFQSLTYLAVFATAAFTALHAQEQPRVVKGVIDLSSYNFLRDGPVELKGEYEFYWNQMLNPSSSGEGTEMNYIKVPGSWYRLRNKVPEIERHGFATYRLMIRLPENVDQVALKIQDVYSASGYFLDGKAIDYLGFPGVNKYQTVTRYSRPVVRSEVNNREVELLIRVANFDHRLSGIAGGITLGLADQMQQLREREMNRGHFLIGAFMIIGIYFLGLYLIRSEQYRLYFSLICLLMAMRTAMILDLPFELGMNLNGLTMARLDLLNVYFFAPFFTLMISSIFPFEFPKPAFRILLWISLVFIIFVVVSPVSLFSYTLTWFFGFFVAECLLILYVVMLAWSRGRSHAPVFALGLIILFAGILNDLLYEIDAVDTEYMGQYTMFIYLLIYAYIFADKSNNLQRQAEKLATEVSQVKNNLEQLVEERTTELQSMSKQLEKQKMQLESTNKDLVEAINARNRLFAIIGHDVRAPIGYTRQALEMILENKEITDKERDELLRMMANSSAVTYNLLDNLLVWGRSQTGKLKANAIHFQLKALVDESLELVRIGLKEKKLKVEVYVSEDHYLEADRDHLYIVIRNLLSNAIKFTPEKGSIYISSKKEKAEVVISLRDTGIGIPKAIIAKLTDARSHVSTDGTKGEKGSGLGLKICKEIIQTNHGWLRIESESGSGSTILLGIKAGKKTD